jgi:predicted ATP-grasp superfamily ATP-dependent carboligase
METASLKKTAVASPRPPELPSAARAAILLGRNRGACVALARAGVRVAVVDSAPAGREVPRGVPFFRIAPYAPPAPAAFADRLEDVARRILPGGRPVLFAVSDAGLLAVATWHDRLEATFDIACPPPALTRLLVDKAAFALWCAQSGIPTPAARVVRLPGELEDALAAIVPPLIVKPHHTFALEEVHERKLYWAATAEEAYARARDCLDQGLAVVLQEDLSGPGTVQWSLAGLCDEHGQLREAVLARKLRQITWGAGTAMETAPMDARIRGLAQEVCTRLRSHGALGLFEMEICEPSPGDLRVLEVNARIWRQVRLPAAAGVNLLHRAFLRRLSLPLPPVKGYRAHVGWVRWRADFSACLALLRRRALSVLPLARSLTRVRVIE